ncbi:MAG: hypothetical protein ABI673_01210 [Novosphingobium sp.]
MDLGFDHQEWLQRPPLDAQAADQRPGALVARPLDWFSLKARFIAAHALAHELRDVALATPPGGSFVADGAQVLEWQRKMLPDVNPTGLADGKARSGTGSPVVGNPSPITEDYYD